MNRKARVSEELKAALDGIAALPVTEVSAPTPEVEPFATISVPLWGEPFVTLKEGIERPCELQVYTHPAPPSELVKAAREVLDAYDNDPIKRLGAIRVGMDHLRAALDKVKS